MIMDRLYQNAKKSPVCVGLDTRPDFLPKAIADMDISIGDKVFEFNRRIIDATIDAVGCFKIQIACYEALGLEGMRAFAKTVSYARKKGGIVISDIKRGDISSTAKQYALGHFSGDFETDIITVNAYMGEDAVSPYYEYLNEKGLFILIKTSNPSGKDFEDQKLASGETLYEKTAALTSKWGEAFIGESGFSAIGAVVGCTYPEEFKRVKKLMPHTFFLIPGYGAQGGTGKDIASFFEDGICGVVNNSRALLTAYKGKTEGLDFAEHVYSAAEAMRKDILQWL